MVENSKDEHCKVDASTFYSFWEHGYYHGENIIEKTFSGYQKKLFLNDHEKVDTFIRFMKVNPTKRPIKMSCDGIE